MEDQLAARGCGVDVFLQAHEPDIMLIQVRDERNEVLERAAESVQSPDHQGIACAHVVHGVLQARPFRFRATRRIRENLLAASSRERVRLEVECLILGGNAGVAGLTHETQVSN